MSSTHNESTEAPLARSQDSASEAAQLLADLVRDKAAFPEAAVRHLVDLLGHSLAVGSVGERREARLGLLIELVARGQGEFIASSTYETARTERKSRGEEWPAASSLSRAYGHWLTAVRAACRYWFDGGRGNVAHDHIHTGRQLGYRPQEIQSALLQAQAELGLRVAPDRASQPVVDPGRLAGRGVDGRPSVRHDKDQWPTEWEYLEWARIKRRLARRAGVRCRLPERGAICAAYGTYAAAVEAVARRAVAAAAEPRLG